MDKSVVVGMGSMVHLLCVCGLVYFLGVRGEVFGLEGILEMYMYI